MEISEIEAGLRALEALGEAEKTLSKGEIRWALTPKGVASARKRLDEDPQARAFASVLVAQKALNDAREPEETCQECLGSGFQHLVSQGDWTLTPCPLGCKGP